MIERILVPIDGSAHSKKALDIASELAEKFAAKLFLLHVVEGVATEQTMVMGSSHVTYPVNVDAAKESGREVTDAATKLVEAKGLKVADAEVFVGSAAKKILQSADDNRIDTIVMGSRGLSDLTGLLMGSVSHKVGHLAKCTCITVR